MGTRRKGSKTDKNSSTSSNPLVQILHNKWRYYSRKHKSPPRVEVVIALIVVIFIALNYVGKLFHSGSEASASTCIDGLDAQGYICDASNSTETGEVVEGEVLDGGEQGAVVEGEPSDNSENSENSENTGVAVVGEDGENSEEGDSSDYEDDTGSPGLIANIMSMFQLNTINSLKSRFHEWWTGDNPGFRQISGETVPMEDRQFSFDVDFLASAPNARFVFHNKLPKTGSTTMHNIVGLLSRRNNFTYWKIMSGVMKFGDESTLVQALRMRYREPFFLLQHHYWMDFEKYDMVQPTFVNMIREPVTWFQSHYSFMKYGANSRKANSGVENLSKDIQECIKEDDKLCQGNPWTYIEFFCGSDKFCNQIKNGDDDAKSKVLDIAKRRVVHQYYVVGILEQFEDTLRMFETMLPDFYSGAMTAWRSDYIQFRRNQTKTIKGEILDDASREFLAHNALKYESDFYWFCRYLFNERMRALQIEPSPNTNT